MKAKNHKEVSRSYLKFSTLLFSSILVAVSCVWFFIQTYEKEISRIETRSAEYDISFEQQIMLTDEVASLYSNLSLMNSNKEINHVVLQNRISTQKMNLINTLEGIDKKDVLLYLEMSSNINSVLSIKDSIRQISMKVEQVKTELQRCIHDNKDASRKMIFN